MTRVRWHRAGRLGLPALVVSLAAGAAAAAGQTAAPAVDVGATMLLVTHRHQGSDGVEPKLTGVAFGVSGRLRLHRLEVGLEYTEGRLHPPGQAGGGRAFVEGSLDVGVLAMPWLLLDVGPSAYDIRTPVQRRIQAWKLGARLIFPLVSGWARGWASVSTDVGGNAGDLGGLDSGTAAAVGLRVAPTTAPVWAETSYEVVHDRVGAGGSESSERLRISVGVRMR